MANTILLVDDSDAQRQLVRIGLQKEGYEVMEASSAEAALDMLRKQKISLLISDVNMPGMNGVEMVAKIKSDPGLKFTSIMMLTTESQEALKKQGEEMGVKVWMNKPFQMQDLLTNVQRLVS